MPRRVARRLAVHANPEELVKRAFVLVTLLGCGPKTTPAPVAAEASDPSAQSTEIWKGQIETPAMPLSFTAELERSGDAWTGVIDIPLQGALGVPLADVSSTSSKVAFSLPIPGAKAALFAARRTGDTATGNLKQMGQEYPLQMHIAEPGESRGPSRPQTPVAPFPYQVAEVTYTDGEMTFAGTLTKPEGKGLFPAVLLITGSGAQDRDETIFAHKPFAVIADHLTRNGIAALRVDDRGVGGTNGVLGDARSEDLVADVLAGVRYLRDTDGIDPAQIGLVGHSEGGIVGPQAAAADPDIKFVVMLAGTGLPGRDILMLQGRAMYENTGASGEALDRLMELHAAAYDATPENREEAIVALVKGQLANQGLPTSGQQFDQTVEGAMHSFDSPWFESFVALDPRVALRQVQCPVLALNGSLDFQVPPDENLPEIEAALSENEDVTIREFEGLNHLFQPAKTGMLDEYGQIEMTIAPEVLDVISDWIQGHTSSSD